MVNFPNIDYILKKEIEIKTLDLSKKKKLICSTLNENLPVCHHLHHFQALVLSPKIDHFYATMRSFYLLPH